MILKRINETTQVIYTNDRNADIKSIANELGYLKKDGGFYKNVDFQPDVNYITESSSIIISNKFVSKGVTTYVINDTYSIDNGNIDELVTKLAQFGDYEITLKNILFKSFEKISGKIVTTVDGVKISFGKPQTKVDLKPIDAFIYKMSMDNGRMLQPLLKRFFTTAFLFKGNKALLTGYANLKAYLSIIKEPSTAIINLRNEGEIVNYVADIESTSMNIKITDVNNGNTSITLDFIGSLTEPESTIQFEPYILLTTKPIVLGNQRFPFNVIKQKEFNIFLTPLYFNSRKILNELRGGINLLS